MSDLGVHWGLTGVHIVGQAVVKVCVCVCVLGLHLVLGGHLLSFVYTIFLFTKWEGASLYSASSLISQYLFCFWDVLYVH